MTRPQLEERFKDYPDLVTLPQFREMLGGVGLCTVRKLVTDGIVEHLMVKMTYYIPKEEIIYYILSPHYSKLKTTLKHRID